MIILLRNDVPADSLKKIFQRLHQMGKEYRTYEEGDRRIIAVLGAQYRGNLDSLEALPGVEKIISVSKPYKLVSREFIKTDTVIVIGGVPLGGTHFQVIAGPCAVESEEQLLTIAADIKKAGAAILRGGAFKPRTSPYSFQGLEEEGLKILAKAREITGLPVVTEAMDVRDMERVAYYADMIQIGSRNMQNYPLLKEAARTKKPILLKRGLSATLEEWLLAGEYILMEGNRQVVFCERGIRTFENYTRNTLDLSAVAAIRELSHLPVIVDPSHGTGRWQLVAPLAKAAVPVGAHGIMVEVHHRPSEALSDGEQSLTPHNFRQLMEEIDRLKAVQH